MHHHDEQPPRWAAELLAHQRIERDILSNLVLEIFKMTAATDRLTASVQANTDATNAAITAGIGSAPPGGDDAATEALINAQADQVDANTSALKAATPAGATPVAPVTPVPASVTTPRPGF